MRNDNPSNVFFTYDRPMQQIHFRGKFSKFVKNMRVGVVKLLKGDMWRIDGDTQTKINYQTLQIEEVIDQRYDTTEVFGGI